MSGQYPKAHWRGPVPNMNPSGMHMPPIGLVLHIQEGHEEGTDAWFHNPASEVSAHFGAPVGGGIDQWVMVGDKAWHASAANTNYCGVEIEGNSGDKLTVEQAESISELLAWLHQTYAIPLSLCNTPGQPGLAYHALGGEAWGGHFDCPGTPIIDARPALIARAAELVGATPPPASGSDSRVTHLQQLLNAAGANPTLLVDGIRGAHTNAAFLEETHGRNIVQGDSGALVSIVQAMLVCWGASIAIDGQDGPLTTAAVESFQRAHPACGGADGQVGPKTQAALAS